MRTKENPAAVSAGRASKRLIKADNLDTEYPRPAPAKLQVPNITFDATKFPMIGRHFFGIADERRAA